MAERRILTRSICAKFHNSLYGQSIFSPCPLLKNYPLDILFLNAQHSMGEMVVDAQYTNKRRRRVKLIFNPVSGANRGAPVKLMDVIKELQAWKLVPEPYLTEPDSDFSAVVNEAVTQGIHMFVACGGDGTVSAVARAMPDTGATLGIIPTGTQNNIAYSLGIPADIPAAIAVLRTGKRDKIDMGIATCGNTSTPFFEICSVGLFSALFESGDRIQHGDITRIGDLLSTLTASPPSKIRLLLNGKHEIKNTGHVVLVSNMPFIGRRYQMAPPGSFRDGFLDVLFCSDIPKLNLMVKYILKVHGNKADDPRIMNFRVRKILIETNPAMAVMADGICLGEGSVSIEIRRGALPVIVPDSSIVN